MADAALVELLKKGVDAFASWREDNPAADLDLEGAGMRGLQLSGVDLSGARLSKAP